MEVKIEKNTDMAEFFGYMSKRQNRDIQSLDTINYFVNAGILLPKGVMAYDLMFTTVLYRCINQEEPSM